MVPGAATTTITAPSSSPSPSKQGGDVVKKKTDDSKVQPTFDHDTPAEVPSTEHPLRTALELGAAGATLGAVLGTVLGGERRTLLTAAGAILGLGTAVMVHT